ncbi:protein sax-3-like isoform X2 [Ptychodera flava]|uniref:protein sax-3-like isoform X2 n=1 Tax=Ptychodera flava TaxID=63121 RepID=UPI00396A0DB2
MFIGVLCRSLVFSWAIISVFGQSTPTPHEGDTDGACLGNPCDENGPCFNRPTTVDGKTQYVCECPDNMIYTGDLCDQFGGPTNDKETCFGRDCYVGFFTSPNYPNGYLPRHRKIYTLYAPGAKSVTFTTHENFSVESHKDEFYIGTGLTYPTTLDFVNKTSDPLQYVFQGYTAAPPFSLPGNEFWMIFDTDRTVEFMGWRLDWIAYEQQSFDEEPMSINVTEGDDVMFNCSVLNKQGVMSWSKDGSEIINNDLNMVSSSGRYDIINNVENVEYNLLVQNVDRSSAGSYIAYVSAQNGHSAIQSQAAILVVHTAAIQRFVEQPSDVEIVEGNDTFLKCKIENKEGTVIWYKDGVAISSDASIINGDLRLSIIGDHSAGEYYLAFLGLTVADAGNYSVVVTAADNSPEIRSEEAALTVLRHQWFIRTPESLSIVEGQTLNLHVTVGNKRGTLSWIKDGYIVLNYDLAVAVNDARVSISNPSQGVYDLVITDVTLADAGTYQVSVTGGDSDNPISTTAITLSVNDLETQSFVRTPESAEIAVSSRFVLHSQVDHREGDVIWSRNGVDISLNGAITNGDSRYSITGDPSLGEYHLMIDNVQHSDAGNFKVRVTAADNSPEIESADASVTTRGPTEPLSDYPKCSLERINNNKTLQLTCESRGGDPPAALEWTRDGSVIVGSIAAASNSTGSKHVLEMESTYSLEGAIFTCVSSHVTFTESKMCMIGPLETGTSRIPDDNFPKCSIANENLILDDSALLICETRGGIPPATLEWSKDGVIYEGQWMNTETETVNGLLLNLTADLEGAVFVCSSDHPSYEETKTCEIGPLKFTSSPWYSSPWIWLLLGLLLLALLILLIILLICCCCCGRRRYCFCADACLAICPCCTCCKGVKHADAATMVETDTADTAIIVHSTYAGSPRKSEISTRRPDI